MRDALATPNTSAGMTLNLISHNGLLAIDAPWHNRDSPEFGEEHVPYVELRKNTHTFRFDDGWCPSRGTYAMKGIVDAVLDMVKRGLAPSGYTHVRVPKGYVIPLQQL
jgi:hypothetical protein